MITVKQLLPLLRNAKEIYLDWNGFVRKIDRNDVLDIDAYGDYAVDSIFPRSNKEGFELCIMQKPVKSVED